MGYLDKWTATNHSRFALAGEGDFVPLRKPNRRPVKRTPLEILRDRGLARAAQCAVCLGQGCEFCPAVQS